MAVEVDDVESTGRLLTAADLAALPDELPSGPVKFELDNGKLVVMSPPGRRHGKLQSRLGAFLTSAEEAGLGEAYAEVGIVLWRDPDRVVGSDAAFVSTSRGPVQETREGYLETIPDIVVEIRSKNDSLAEVRRKIEDYLAAGVTVVWFIDPAAKTATVYRRDAEPLVLPESQSLADTQVLPGHELPLAKLFRR